MCHDTRVRNNTEAARCAVPCCAVRHHTLSESVCTVGTSLLPKPDRDREKVLVWHRKGRTHLLLLSAHATQRPTCLGASAVVAQQQLAGQRLSHGLNIQTHCADPGSHTRPSMPGARTTDRQAGTHRHTHQDKRQAVGAGTWGLGGAHSGWQNEQHTHRKKTSNTPAHVALLLSLLGATHTH